jgi:hypothetical protein
VGRDENHSERCPRFAGIISSDQNLVKRPKTVQQAGVALVCRVYQKLSMEARSASSVIFSPAMVQIAFTTLKGLSHQFEGG